MQIRQSNLLTQHLRSASVHSHKIGAPALVPDLVALSLIVDRRTHASKILHKLLKEWEIEQIVLRLHRDISTAAARPESQTGDVRDMLVAVMEGSDSARDSVSSGLHEANTGHTLLWVAGNRQLIVQRILELYDINTKKIAVELNLLPHGEDAMTPDSHYVIAADTGLPVSRIEELKEKVYAIVREIHSARFPYNDFLYTEYSEEDAESV